MFGSLVPTVLPITRAFTALAGGAVMVGASCPATGS